MWLCKVTVFHTLIKMSATTKVSIVLIGEFNPDNFLPKKLAESGVISKKSAESASIIALLPGQTTQVNLGWAELAALKTKLQVSCVEAPYIRICDLVMKALSDLSPRSTVSQFGINVEFNYDFGNFADRNDFGCRIAPPEAWGAWGQMLRASMTGEERGTSLQGGAISVHMRKPFVADEGVTGWLDVMVTRSVEHRTGITISTNHHHQMLSLDPDVEEERKSLSDEETTSILLRALSSRFEKSIEEAISIFEGVIR